ncbi:peptidoglycan-binding protein, partial [Alkalibacillus haloalkaliphilus]|uniref:peptidoglycan-binding protein n=1 Tax=Alkalibacillus haloalkaliphilus TaxID=94136 RepID=UPI001580D2AD
NSPLQNGNSHEDVLNLKEGLVLVLALDNLSINEEFDSDTEKAVRDFQVYYGLVENGIADEPTLQKLEETVNNPFQKGNRHDDVPKIKGYLMLLGYGDFSRTTLFGIETETAVKEFQADFGLITNGILDEKAYFELEYEATRPLEEGMRRADVVDLKVDLQNVGFGNFSNTNYYGPQTRGVVEDFQSQYGLPVTGIVNSDTLYKLNEILSNPLQSGNYHDDAVELKEMLMALGYGDFSKTRYYGPQTASAVREFQADYGLPISGITDEITLELLQEYVVKIFIDPGHGGSDPGAVAYGLEEKEVALDISLKLGNALMNNYKGVIVEYARTEDEFIELEDRSKMANNWGADYFVSVHSNAYLGQGSGFETYVHTNASSESHQRQNTIHTHLVNEMNLIDRGQKNANFNVLRNTEMPAILLEYLFIDNYTENQMLRDPFYRQSLADVTAEAIADSFNLDST